MGEKSKQLDLSLAVISTGRRAGTRRGGAYHANNVQLPFSTVLTGCGCLGSPGTSLNRTWRLEREIPMTLGHCNVLCHEQLSEVATGFLIVSNMVTDNQYCPRGS